MFNFDYITKKGSNKHNSNWSGIQDYLYRTLIVGDSGFGKTYVLINLKTINQILIKFMQKIHMKQNINC